jgi:hypothetical protein
VTSRFRQVVDAVWTEFAIIRAGQGYAPFVVDENWLTGRLAAIQTKQPPYVAWVRGAGSMSTPPGGNSACGTSDLQVAVQPLYDLSQSVFAIISGKDEEDTENLWFDAIRAVVAALGRYASPRTYRWVTQEEDSAAYEFGGNELVIQEFEWPMILPVIQSTVVITNVAVDEVTLKPTDIS